LKLKSLTPLLMHNGRLANPLDPFARDLKKLTGKRGKTDADIEEIGKREFFGGIYWNSEVGPHIPDMMMQRVIEEGAKKYKLGKAFKSAVFVEGDAKLEYDGPRDVAGLFDDKNFVHQSMVKIGTSKNLRVRPMFQKWEATVKIVYDETVVEETQVKSAMESAGRFVGVGDWRPRYGRFSVDNI
ncbi:MAG: hypothetical protein KGJ13_12965, partial [Patescibacteria group bacterium]|nr:hypothetical protein [Patescibacteria group bacterium]